MKFDRLAKVARNVGRSLVKLSYGGVWPPAPDDDWWYGSASAGSYAGEHIGETSSLRSATVLSCVKIITGAGAHLPLNVYQRLPGGGKTVANGQGRAINHPLNSLLHDAPNPSLTAFEYKERMLAHLELWGNHYSLLDMNAKGVVTALWPLRPDRMQVRWAVPGDIRSGRIYLYTMEHGAQVAFTENEILHVPGMGFDGLIGYSPIGLMVNQIGLDITLMKYASKFFANGATLGYVLKHPVELSPDQRKHIEESFRAQRAGVDRAHRVMVLEEGMDLKEITVPPEHAQFLESRKFTRGEIAGMFQVPPHLIGDTEKTTSWGTGIEQQNIGFAQFCLLPRLGRIEDRLNLSLLGVRERVTFFCEFNMMGMLRGDAVGRSAYYRGLTETGAISPNEIRALENMNPYPGGDHYRRPLNTAFIDSEGNWVSTPLPGAPSKSALAESLAELLCEAAASRRAIPMRKVTAPQQLQAGEDE